MVSGLGIELIDGKFQPPRVGRQVLFLQRQLRHLRSQHHPTPPENS